MEKILAAYGPQAYAIMRIVLGLLFFCHGLQKVFGFFGGVNGAPAPLLSLLGHRRPDRTDHGDSHRSGSGRGERRFCRQRADGGGLFHRAFAGGLLADSQRRRGSALVLLCVSLHGHARLGYLEHRLGSVGSGREPMSTSARFEGAVKGGRGLPGIAL